VTQTADAAPTPLKVAGALVLLEGLALIVLSVAELFNLTSERATMGVSTSLFFVVYAVAIGLCAWRLTLLDSWARSPVVLAQLIQLGVAWSFRGGDTTWVALVLALVAAVVLGGIFHPESMQALSPEE
jgi:hypothetical protein